MRLGSLFGALKSRQRQQVGQRYDKIAQQDEPICVSRDLLLVGSNVISDG
jgi:hypothetical protein